MTAATLHFEKFYICAYFKPLGSPASLVPQPLRFQVSISSKSRYELSQSSLFLADFRKNEKLRRFCRSVRKSESRNRAALILHLPIFLAQLVVILSQIFNSGLKSLAQKASLQGKPRERSFWLPSVYFSSGA
ncbi:hypothetical protein RPE78_09825 [Thioclava litoralis]|uniref:Uncharacterized protein n=1 Tax=Thioclava litoralis TaxID=3076557 RepID=A0ABZ1DXX1_9RHOB|nr:hypothetical protein RPE78_09825 [Thioclava sp. FTW29]